MNNVKTRLKLFPGMLLRLFMYMYDLEVIDEEAYFRWKEEVNDEYPGKGKSLFQVRSLASCDAAQKRRKKKVTSVAKSKLFRPHKAVSRGSFGVKASSLL